MAGCARFHSQPLSPAETAAGLENRSLGNPNLKAFWKELKRGMIPWPAATWDFEMVTLAAFYYHPEPGRRPRRTGQARAGIVTAGARPNPKVGFTPQYVFNPVGLPAWMTI